MLIIRQEHMDAFEKAAQASFEQRARDHLRSQFPSVCARLGEERLMELIRDGIGKARGYGFEIEAQVAGYLELMLMFGPRFDTDSRHGWARVLLLDRAQPPAMRMHRLRQQAKLQEHLKVRIRPPEGQ